MPVCEWWLRLYLQKKILFGWLYQNENETELENMCWEKMKNWLSENTNKGDGQFKKRKKTITLREFN